MDVGNGSVVWAVSMGGTSHDYGIASGITSVGLDKVAVTGSFHSYATFGDHVLSRFFDVFIAMVSVCTLLFAIN